MMTMLFLCCCAVLLTLGAGVACACTTVLVGKDASATGEVLLGHNEDSSGRYLMRTLLVPATSDRAATVRFEANSASVPLLGKRTPLFWSEARTFFAKGASFCDFYVNGNGVVICSDNCGASREDRPDLTDGGIGYALRRLTAENARSAAHAVEIAAGLVERFGYVAGGRSYHFADKNECWVMQVVRGKHYAVKRVPDDHIYVNPNHFTIREPDPGTPGFADLIAYAVKRGWYQPENGETFDFARAFQAPADYRAEKNINRHRRGLEILLGQDLDKEMELPFSVKATHKVGVADIKSVLRCHYEGTAEDTSQGGSPHYMPSRPICTSTTLESTIVQIRQDNDLTVIRRALGRPCLSPYVPWYFGIDSLPEGYSGGDPEEALATHFAVDAHELDHSDRLASFSCGDLETAADLQYAEKASAVKEAIYAFENKLEDELQYFEPVAAELLARDRQKGRALLTASVCDWAERTMSEMHGLCFKLHLVLIDAPEQIELDGGEFSVSLLAEDLADLGSFKPSELDLSSTTFAPSYARVDERSYALGADLDEGRLRLRFAPGRWKLGAAPCLTDMWLRLTDSSGHCAVGCALVRLEAAKGADA